MRLPTIEDRDARINRIEKLCRGQSKMSAVEAEVDEEGEDACAYSQ